MLVVLGGLVVIGCRGGGGFGCRRDRRGPPSRCMDGSCYWCYVYSGPSHRKLVSRQRDTEGCARGQTDHSSSIQFEHHGRTTGVDPTSVGGMSLPISPLISSNELCYDARPTKPMSKRNATFHAWIYRAQFSTSPRVNLLQLHSFYHAPSPTSQASQKKTWAMPLL